MPETLPEQFLNAARREFAGLRRQAERALEQVSDDEFFATLDAETNSIAIIVKHMAGNMRSRWTDFLTSDGEKPWRDRDAEFELTPADSRPTLMERWNTGWSMLNSAVEPLKGEDLETVVTIRGEPHTVLQAIQRQVSHYAYHVGQIVQLARHYRITDWKMLSVPRGKSAEFNAEMERRRKRR